MLRMFAYLSPMGWLDIYSVYGSQLEGSKDSFPLDEIFLAFIGFDNGYRKSSLLGVIFLPYWGIRFGDELLLSFFPY